MPPPDEHVNHSALASAFATDSVRFLNTHQMGQRGRSVMALLDARASPAGRDTFRMQENVIAILNKLIAVCKTGEELFEVAATEVHSSPLQSMFRGYSLQRSRFSRDLDAAALALGKSAPTTDVMAESGVETHIATGRNEQTVVEDCEREEEAAVSAYSAALEEPELPSAVQAMITAQAADIKAAHKEIREFRTRFEPQGKK